MALEEALRQILVAVLEELRREHRRRGRGAALIRLVLTHPDLEYPVMSSTASLDNANIVADVFDKLETLLKSKKELDLEKDFGIEASIVDDPNRPELFYLAGLKTFTSQIHWTLNFPPKWKTSAPMAYGSKNTFIMPDIPRDPAFADCCLLAAVVFGMAHRKLLQGQDTGDWSKLRRINSPGAGAGHRKDRDTANITLRTLLVTAKAEFDLDVDAWKRIKFRPDNEEQELLLRREVDKLGISLEIVSDASSYATVFRHPKELGWKRMRIVVLSLTLLEANYMHAAYVRNPDAKTLYDNGFKSSCPFCGRKVSYQSLLTHLCNPAFQKCQACKRKLVHPEAYLDEQVNKFFCPGGEGYEEKCDHCNRKRWSDARCRTIHKRFCNEGHKRCAECGGAYWKEEEHQCGTVWCGVCKKKVPRVSFGGEKKDGHVCVMAKPKPNANPVKLAFYDFETGKKNASPSFPASALMLFLLPRSSIRGGRKRRASRQRSRSLL